MMKELWNKFIDWVAEKPVLHAIYLVCGFVLIFFMYIIPYSYFFMPLDNINGPSMAPTIENFEGQDAMGLKYYDYLYELERGDIVSTKKSAWGLIKRIVGLPGETISCRDDVIYINGEPLEEEYLDNDLANGYRQSQGYFTADFGPITLGEDEYYLLGDNRMNSHDSRVIGAFSLEDIDSIVIWWSKN